MATTPLILIAGQALLENTALAKNSTLEPSLSSYAGLPFVVAFSNMVATLISGQYDVSTNPEGIALATVQNMTHMFDSTMPWASNVIPVTTEITTSFLTEYISAQAGNIITGIDNGVFITNLLAVASYVQTANDMVNSAVNGASLGANTFTSMDALMSGNILAVSKQSQQFGQDLCDSGLIFDFSKLDIIGSPQSLLERLSATNLLSSLLTEFSEVGIDIYTLQEAILDNPDLIMKPSPQKRAYGVFENVTGQKLQDLLLVLRVQTEGIETLADLLDVKKMFPTSFNTLMSLNNGSLELMYEPGTTNAAEWVTNLPSDLALVMPEELAKLNAALGISMGQIKSIHKTTPVILGTQAKGLETNLGLDGIDALEEPLPTSVTQFYKDQVGKGSGPDGTFYITDGVGSAAGLPHNTNLSGIISTISAMQATTAFDPFNDVFSVVNGIVSGAYQTGSEPNPEELIIPDGLPGGGVVFPGITYASTTAATNAVYAEATILVSALFAAHPGEAEENNVLFNSSLNHVNIELQTLAAAGVNFESTFNTDYDTVDPLAVTPSIQTILGFASSLHTYGTHVTKGGIAEILEQMVTDTIGGQSIVAAMREGRNIKKLADAGVSADNAVSSAPKVVEPGNIAPSSY